MPKPPAFEARHVVDGRLRLRSVLPMDPDALRALADRLAALPPIRRVVSRPNTGSLIVEFDGSAPPVVEAVGASGLVRLRVASPPPPIRMVAGFALMRADAKVKGATEGTLDLSTLFALLLLMGAVVQVARGRLASPATSLVMAAFAMLDRAGRDAASGQ